MSRYSWLLLVAMATPLAQAQPARQEQATAENTTNDAAPAPEKKRRLKFKGDRPSCTCATALGERDIEAAAAEKAAMESQTRRSEK